MNTCIILLTAIIFSCSVQAYHQDLEPCTAADLSKLIPDPENCSRFFECTQGGWVGIACYPGLDFNPATSRCDYPENVICPNQAIKQQQELEPCTATDLDKLIPDPRNCSRFYECTQGGWIGLACYPGLEFNSATSKCDYPENVICPNELKKHRLHARQGLEPCTATDLSKLIPDPKNCSRFYECTQGGWVGIACYPGLDFNPVTSKCDYPENVICPNQKNKERLHEHRGLEPCTATDLSKLIPDPKNCSRFYECTQGGWVGIACYPGLDFNPVTSKCDYPENVICPNQQNKRHLHVHQGLEPCTATDLSKLIPDPKNCSRFYECTQGGWVGIACYPGLDFNPVTSRCDYPENVICPNQQNKGHLHAHQGLEPCTATDLSKLIPDPKNCSRFYECTQGGWVGNACYPGLDFNPATSKCDYPENVICPNQQKKERLDEHQELEPCTVTDLDKLIPDPKNCSRFYECTLGGWVGLACYPGLDFNPVTSRCDYPENVICPNQPMKKSLRADQALEPCTATELSKLIPDPKNCSRFYECTQGGWVGIACYPGLDFNPATSRCDFPENVICPNQVMKKPSDHLEDSLGPCTSQKLRKLVPDPKNCSKYYECTVGGWVRFTCAPSLFFNPDTNQCDYPANVDCKTETKKQGVQVRESCTSSNYDQLIPDPSDCRRFLECSSMGWVSLPCPGALKFNPAISKCDFPENVHCN